MIRSWVFLFAVVAVAGADDERARREFERNKRIGEARKLARGAASGAPRLRRLLEDEEPEVRLEAAKALHQLLPESDEGLDALVGFLRGKGRYLARGAGGALVELGDRGIAKLVAEVRSGPARAVALWSLYADEVDPKVFLGLKQQIRDQLRASKNDDERYTCMLIAASQTEVARLCVPDALPLVRHWLLALPAVKVLESAGPRPSYIKPLRALINDGETVFDGKMGGIEEYETAASILSRCGDAGIATVLDRIGSLPPESDWYLRALLEGMERHLDLVYEAALEATRSGNASLRRRILPTLLAPKDKARLRRSFDAILRLALIDESPAVRHAAVGWLRHAAKGLGELPRREELRAAARNHEDAKVRLGVIQVLAEYERIPFPVLDRLWDGASTEERKRAIWLIADHGPAAARYVPALLKRLEANESILACMFALARIAPGDPAVARAVVARLDSDEEFIVHGTVRVIGMIGPPAKAAVPRLRELARTLDGGQRPHVIWTLWKVTQSEADREAVLQHLRDRLDQYSRLTGWEYALIGEWMKGLGPHAKTLYPRIERALKDGRLGEERRAYLKDLLR